MSDKQDTREMLVSGIATLIGVGSSVLLRRNKFRMTEKL